MARRKAAPSSGIAEAVLGEIDLLRPQRGRMRSGQQGASFRFSPRAGQLWRFALGSNAAVLKKIGRGGTSSAKELKAQMDYLFSKSAALFGNAVAHDPNARGLTADERREIADIWPQDWRGSPKNGHTTHLLLSFPSHVRPDKAKLIAEAWAFEMFQSGEHQAEEWAYVAALHTDRAHPHAHIVVNNRGLVNDAWFYMAREHVFNLDTMKACMVAIAAEEGVFLDATSRAERGILSYGPSRGEIERARAEGRAPEERPREGRALEEALATLSRSSDAMKSLAHVATLTGLPEIAGKISQAEEALRRGGVVHPFPAGAATAERADLDRHFSGWMAETADRIRSAPHPAPKALRDEFYGYAIDIARGLGDARGAGLLHMQPQSKLYATALDGDHLVRGREVAPLRPGAADQLRSGIIERAEAIGLSGARLQERLGIGAANAWEERDWVRSDLLAVAGRRRADLRNPEESHKVAGHLQGFYDAAAGLIEHSVSHEAVPENVRLVKTLKAMARTMLDDGKVEFRNDIHAERFAQELRQRYGDGIVSDLAAGRTDGLAGDVEDAGQRMWIARAVVSAAKTHVAIGLTLREAADSEAKLAGNGRPLRQNDWER
ncbi:MAG: relaxase/mobilization nuclease domain-containing protein [Alphaproteobacteria bacterium]|nr:relaxase/mobilization nuclease domain-containing protein [Alphaproteobacteria bacterium]